MAGDTIGKLSLLIGGDVKGLKQSTDEAKKHIGDLTSYGAKATLAGGGMGGGVDFKTLFGGGIGAFAGPIAGLTAAVYAAMKFGESLKAAGQEVKTLQLESEKAGVSFDWMQRAGHYAEQVGIELQAVITGFAKFRRNMYTAVFGEMDAKTAIAQLGLTEQALLLPKQALYKEVATRIVGIGDAFKRAAIEVAIFGKSGQELELWFRKMAANENEPLISKTAAAALRQFKDEWRDIEEKYHAWWMNVKGGFLELLGFGRTHAQLARDAAASRAREAQEAKDTARALAEKAFTDEATAKNALAEAALGSMAKMQESLKDAIDKSGGATEEEIQRLRMIGEAYKGGITPDTSELDALIKAAAAAKEKMESQREAAAATKAAAMAEEQFIAATAKAHEWAQRRIVTAQQEASLIRKAQDELLQHWKSEAPQLPGLALQGSQEAYKFSMEDRQRSLTEAQNQTELAKLQLEAQKEATKQLEEINRKFGKPPMVVTMGGGS